jgi:hypothetical protein
MKDLADLSTLGVDFLPVSTLEYLEQPILENLGVIDLDGTSLV